MNKLYDAVIIGGGPAGLTAAIYLARARYRVLVVEQETFGGQITITSEVVNYPGVASTNGKALTETMRKQAESFGAEFLLAKAEKLDLDGDVKTVHTSRGAIDCFGILLATGASPRRVGFQGEEEFRGRGVAYCATCDGEFFTGKEVFVVGGGFAAAEEGVFLTRYASHVTILIRGADFSCAKSIADAARSNEKITVLTQTTVDRVSGGDFVDTIVYRNRETGETVERHAPEGGTLGVFVFAGYEPATSLVKDIVELNPQGYIVTDRSQRTNVEGVFAAGDICVKSLRQVVTAVGDGALAATEMERYAASMQKKTGLHPEAPTPAPADVSEPVHEKPAAQTKLFNEAIVAQLNAVFSKMTGSLRLRLLLDDRKVSSELKQYMEEMAALTDKLTVETGVPGPDDLTPCVRVLNSDGQDTGLAFHGVPGGHEFTSFVMGLYNAAGPGQSLDAATQSEISAIDHKVSIKLLVSLSCTMCPETVISAQRIAAANPNVSAEAFDVNHFEALKDRYRVMSVPCVVINDEKVSFGKKNVRQILDLIQAAN